MIIILEITMSNVFLFNLPILNLNNLESDVNNFEGSIKLTLCRVPSIISFSSILTTFDSSYCLLVIWQIIKSFSFALTMINTGLALKEVSQKMDN